jgi:hypothetical protein
MSALGQAWQRLVMPVGAGEDGGVAGAVVRTAVSSAPLARPARDQPAGGKANGSAGWETGTCSFRGREDEKPTTSPDVPDAYCKRKA